MSNKSWPVVFRLSYVGRSRSTGGFDAFGQRILPQSVESTIATDYQWTDSTVGGDLPGFREIIKHGGNATNAVNTQSLRHVASSFSASASRWANPFWHGEGTWQDEIVGQVRVPSPTLPGSSSNADNSAKSSFVKKANSMVTSLQGGVFLGELRETIHTIRHPLDGIRSLCGSYLSKLKKAKPGFKRAREKTKLDYLTSQWLELSYAIKPLLSDAKSAGEALAKVVTSHQSMDTIRGFGKDRVDFSAPGLSQLTQGALVVNYRQSLYDEFEAYYYGALLAEGSGTQFNLDAFGLNLDQFLPTIVELIPYSFLADYFANIGNIVEAVSFNTARLRYWGASHVARRFFVAEVISDGTNKSDPSYISSYVSAGKTVATVNKFDRVEFPSLVPSLNIHIPTYANIWANISALAYQHRSIVPF